jgi:predicted 3-demethylubiquinone-9 3-methyltransferase (glyoxalase superfamily)
MSVQSISPFLWFDRQAEEAANFYVSLFEESRIIHLSRYGESGPGPKGSVMVVGFELMGRRFSALNGGPHFHLDEAFSLMVDCTEQADIDRLWTALGDGGSYSVCGWLKDRFGVSWQIGYAGLPELLTGDPARAQRVMAVVMQSTKIDIARLEAAAAGN